MSRCNGKTITGPEMKAIAQELGLTQSLVGMLVGRYDQSTVSGWYKHGTAPVIVQHVFSCDRCREHFLVDGALLE